MQWLANISVRRPVFASVMILVLLVVGLVGYRTLGVDKFPKVDFPLITIVTPYPGASPAAVETDVSQKVEEAVNTVSGLDTLTSTSTEGVSLVLAQFDLEVNPDKAAQDINEHLATILRDLPPASRPEVRKADPDAAPVLVLSVKGPANIPWRDMTHFADKQVKQRIERLPGVGQIVILGGQERPSRSTSIRSSWRRPGFPHSTSSARSRTATTTFRRGGSARTTQHHAADRRSRIDPSQIRRHRGQADQRPPVKLSDVADIEDDREDAETAAGFDGKPAIALSVRKQSGTNTVAVVDGIQRAVKQLKTQLPCDCASTSCATTRAHPLGLARDQRAPRARRAARGVWSCCCSSARALAR